MSLDWDNLVRVHASAAHTLHVLWDECVSTGGGRTRYEEQLEREAEEAAVRIQAKAVRGQRRTTFTTGACA